MPGYVIHLAVAKEYIRNFRVRDEKEFLKGTLAPDLLAVDGKAKTHYSPDLSSNTDLKKFLKENKLNSSYMEGYFLHLIVDHLFYHEYFPNYDKRLYDDYDKTNKELIKKYNIEVPDEVKDCVKFKKGTPEIIDMERLSQMISDISKKKLKDYKYQINKTNRVTTGENDTQLENINRKNFDTLYLAITILIMCVVMLIAMSQKKGYHQDEIFTFGSSNNRFNNMFWSYNEYDGLNELIEKEVCENRNIFGSIKQLKYYFIDHPEAREKYEENILSQKEDMRWRTREEAEDYLKVNENRFNYKSVYYNQVQDVHPPLFYILVHTIFSIFNNSYSNYLIFIINLPFFIGTCILIWKILRLIGRKEDSLFAVILYGFSIGAISTVTFLRMYMMLTFFTTSYLFINLKILKNDLKITKKTGIYLALNAILGYLTQYFFIIYAILVSGVMIITYVKNKRYKDMRKYISILGISAFIGILLFPFSVKHVFFSKRGINSFKEINYIGKVIEYLRIIIRYFGSGTGVVSALLGLAMLVTILKRRKERDVMEFIIIPTALYILIAAKLTEFIELRYVMCILPIVSIMIIMALNSIFENTKYNRVIAIAALIILIGYGFIKEKPIYLYKEYGKYTEVAEKYKEDDLVYVGFTFFNHMQSMPEFLIYKKTLMIYNDQLDRLKDDEELKDKDEFILSVAWDMEPEKVVEEVLKQTGFTQSELLYEGYDEVDQTIYKISR